MFSSLSGKIGIHFVMEKPFHDAGMAIFGRPPQGIGQRCLLLATRLAT